MTTRPGRRRDTLSGLAAPLWVRNGWDGFDRPNRQDDSFNLYRCFDGGRTRARTLDPLIKSQLLYQLSYAPIATAGQSRSARAGV